MSNVTPTVTPQSRHPLPVYEDPPLPPKYRYNVFYRTWYIGSFEGFESNFSTPWHQAWRLISLSTSYLTLQFDDNDTNVDIEIPYYHVAAVKDSLAKYLTVERVDEPTKEILPPGTAAWKGGMK